jgi:hypothetical protein
MSTMTTTYADGSFDDFEFGLLVADFDEPDRSTNRPSRAAERREGREQIERELGIRRHRSSEREV